MSLHLSNSAGELRFDPRTGATSYVEHTSLMAYLRSATPRPLGWLLAAGALWLAAEGAQWALLRARQAQRRRRAKQVTELEELVALLYSLAPAHLGGFLTNATVQAVERAAPPGMGAASQADVERVLIFASGGWRHTPHSLSAVPSAVPFPGAALGAEGADAAEQDRRLLWWLSVSLGKGTVLNGSLAFLLASVLLRQEKEDTPEHLCLRHQGRRIVNVGFVTGALYNNITPLQGAAAMAAAASASSQAGASTVAASALPSSSLRSHVPITRLELVCEIGVMNPGRAMRFAKENWGMLPDPRSEALALVADMGTSRVLEFWRRNGRLPDLSRAEEAAVFGSMQAHESHPQQPRVLWEKRAVTPPSGKDAWVVVELEPLRPGGTPERIHLDMGIFFAKGISAGWQEDRFRERERSSGKSSSTWGQLRRSLARMSRRLCSFLPAALRPGSSLRSSSSPLPLSSLPRPLMLPDAVVHSSSRSSGLGSRVAESSFATSEAAGEGCSGPRATIALLQKLVLINSSEGPNAVHAQMRSLLLEALDLTGLKNRYLTVRIPLKPAVLPALSHEEHAERRRRAQEEWSPDAAVPSARPARPRRGRSAAQRAKRRAGKQAKQQRERPQDEEGDEASDDERSDEEEDDDEGVVEVDTAAFVSSSEVDQVD